ncbi:MAG: c-type cytochrome, partial [Planctomycetota bacterium]|nr:c-type cytochrome [Planctomycetota bacterium]
MLLFCALALLPLRLAESSPEPTPDAALAAATVRTPGEEPVRFAEVQAVLADRCFACHGPDDRAREAGLRLDRREEALEVLAPGDPEASELVARILDDGADRMPPRDSKLELSAAERNLLVRWVAEGATYDGHWAWTAPGADEPGPEGDAAAPAWAGAWCRDPLDARVAAALDEAGLRPGPEV